VEKELTRERKSLKQPQPASAEKRTNGKPPVRTASDEQFRKAHAKTTKTHAALFRRLAQ
jgi:hypothetical protein